MSNLLPSGSCMAAEQSPMLGSSLIRTTVALALTSRFTVALTAAHGRPGERHGPTDLQVEAPPVLDDLRLRNLLEPCSRSPPRGVDDRLRNTLGTDWRLRLGHPHRRPVSTPGGVSARRRLGHVAQSLGPESHHSLQIGAADRQLRRQVHARSISDRSDRRSAVGTEQDATTIGQVTRSHSRDDGVAVVVRMTRLRAGLFATASSPVEQPWRVRWRGRPVMLVTLSFPPFRQVRWSYGGHHGEASSPGRPMRSPLPPNAVQDVAVQRVTPGQHRVVEVPGGVVNHSESQPARLRADIRYRCERDDLR